MSVLRTIRKGVGKKMFVEFANEFGLVYFGSVDQHDDEHQVLRGMTVSHSHKDSHYMVGSFETYDVSFVERTDRIHSPIDKKHADHAWHVLQFDLHTSKELPHVFIGLHSHSASFYTHLFTKYSHLRPLSLGSIHRHSPEFMMHYRVYGQPGRHLDIETLFDPSIDAVFIKNFGALAIEIVDNSLYIYSEKLAPTKQLLEAMIKNGTWLAGHIDTVAKNLD